MTLIAVMQAASLLVAIAAALIALTAARTAGRVAARAQDWRDSDDGQRTNAAIGALGTRMTQAETRMESMPTAAQLATLTETSRSNHDLLLITRAQLTRIENWMLGDNK